MKFLVFDRESSYQGIGEPSTEHRIVGGPGGLFPWHRTALAMRFTSREHEVPGMATDAVLLHHGKLLLIRRGNEPAKGQWALPGGFVEVGETTEQAVLRELEEETGLDEDHVDVVDLVGVYSDPHRDPRGHIVSITYLCALSDPDTTPDPAGADDADEARWFELDDTPELAFDHQEILDDAVRMTEEES